MMIEVPNALAFELLEHVPQGMSIEEAVAFLLRQQIENQGIHND
ncbi:hypothetical protein PODOV061v2_0046 [Vibrio phage 172P1]|nr:hypothetical protein PODOV061v2_0046 [Vibrio phage 172P1]